MSNPSKKADNIEKSLVENYKDHYLNIILTKKDLWK